MSRRLVAIIVIAMFCFNITGCQQAKESVDKALNESTDKTVEEANDDEKESESGLKALDALEEVEGLEVGEVGTTAVENLLGIYGNETGEIRQATGDFDKLFAYKVAEVVTEGEDDYSRVFNYMSKEDDQKIVAYFDDLLLNTGEYMKILVPETKGGMVNGTFNDQLVYVAIEENGDDMLVSIYVDLTNATNE